MMEENMENMEAESVAVEQTDSFEEPLQDYESDSEEPMVASESNADQTNDSVIKIVLQEGAQPGKVDLIDETQLVDLYNSLGVPLDETNKKYSTWRLNVVHIRGVQEMNTNDVLQIFNDFEPDFIEWVNDLSCNVSFKDSRTAATALLGLTVGLILHKNQDNMKDVPDGVEVIDASSIEISVPPYRWRLGKAHDKAKYLLLRFATSADKKIPGARKLSKFYEKYGLPSERSEKVKEAPRITISNVKLSRKVSRTVANDNVKAKSGSINMKMRADEEEARKYSLESRLGSSVKRRITGLKRSSKGSVWDRLESNESSIVPKNAGRIVKVSSGGLRVFSRLEKSKRPRPSKYLN